MKRLALAVAMLLVGTVSIAQQIGPASTLARHHKPIVGIGYTDYQTEWNKTEVEQTRAYVHIGMGIGYAEEPQTEIYLRLGGADLETETISGAGQGLDADFEPFVAAGIKANLIQRDLPFGIGIVAQGAHFAKWEDNDFGEGFEVEEVWEFEGALPVEVEIWPVIIYGGPVLSYIKGDTEPVPQTGFDGDIEYGDSFGVFGGLALRLGQLSIEAEIQDKEDTCISGLVTYAF